MRIEIRKPVYFIPAAYSQHELFISRSDYIESYAKEHDFYYEEFMAILNMYCAPFGFSPKMNEQTADIVYKTLLAGKKTLEGIYCGITLEGEEKSLYMAYAAYGAPGKRIIVEDIKPEDSAEIEAENADEAE